MKVFVTGANGYIGHAVCRHLSVHGHTVYGLIRSKEQEKALQRIEVIPCVGSSEEIGKFQSIINTCSVVVDTVLDKSTFLNQSTMEAVAKAGEASGTKLKYIYTSGCLSYGDNPGKILTEEDPMVTAPAFTWRQKFTQDILSDKRFHGVVARPGYVYGGNSGGYISPLWTAFADKDKIEVDGNPDKSWAWVHVDDNADAYRRIVEAGVEVVSGKVYNISDFTKATHRQVVEAMARAGGAKGQVVLRDPVGFEIVSNISTVMSSQRIQKELGWYPKHTNFLEKIELYYKSYVAHVK